MKTEIVTPDEIIKHQTGVPEMGVSTSILMVVELHKTRKGRGWIKRVKFGRANGSVTHIRLKSIEATVEALVNDPNLLNTEVNFALTVFLASPPGDPKGYPRIWSMNNRRLKAMQLASKRMRNSDPEVRIKWASESDINYAVQAGKWMNINGGEVEFHSTQSRIRRRVDIATNQAPSTVSASDVKKALNDPQALRDLLGL